MRKQIGALVPVMLLVLTVFGSKITDSQAVSNSAFGPAVDTACMSFNGTVPFLDQSCALCHDTSDLPNRVEPQWSWWESGNLTAFCPATTNQAPNGRINGPANNRVINVGDVISFAGTGIDSDGNLPLSYNWNFSDVTADSNKENPGNVVFSKAGSYTVILTVTDSLGLDDPTPDSRTITVNEPASICTDTDSDGFAIEGGSCGPIDCNDIESSINPGVTELCNDGKDNDCNLLVDMADLDCPLTESCFDNDGDRFSSDGGTCGPIDCNDFDKAINPGAKEACGDDVDNDCDGAVDDDDRECNGGDCIGQIFGEDIDASAIEITKSNWNTRRRLLRVIGGKVPSGEIVMIKNAFSGEVIGVTIARTDGAWRFKTKLRSAAVPCRVRAEIGDHSDEKNVRNAPAANCREPDDEGNGGGDRDDEGDHEDEDDREDEENSEDERDRDD